MIVGVNEAYFDRVNSGNVGLAASFSVNPSSCENSTFYKQYLQFSSLMDQRSGRNTTHLFIDNTANRIMGFVSLRASSIISQGEGNVMLGEPALEISMLAVDKDYERRGVGSSLIDFALSEAAELHNSHIGVRYIILAADPMAVNFYKKMGFVPMEDRWSHMPKENWSAHCAPMVLELDYESEYNESFIDDSDDDDED